MKIALSRLHFPVRSLGPGKRIGIWFQGCSIRCEGCVSTDTWSEGKDLVSIDELFTLISEWSEAADGVSITGGEPFDQNDQLKALLLFLKGFEHLDVFLYSGYPLEEVEKKLDLQLGLVDLLMTDPLDISAPQTLPLRGSDNQRLITLTEKGEGMKRIILSDDSVYQSLDLMFDEDNAWMVGVPKRNDMNRVVKELKKQSVSASTYEMKEAGSTRCDG